ncbi:hypothetical protein WICPIJ_009589 [Wickerhamomyces pijperi]|uniref:Anaphase-promoting complex subunit 4 WD40 domain-containing protein n=1 Tax=Wickerhamomyces pijperi TaxID=599730 RepID=A0A9P8PMP8_WICPI|nr:hypothetical protein WICPIJ_009589 [Wickerhamomyces pijperi]
MSVTREQIWAPSPSTTRSQTTRLSYDLKTDRIVYPSGKSIFIRSISEDQSPNNSIQYSQHNFNVTVAKFAPSGNYIASGDESGLVKIWDVIGEDMVLKGEYQILNGAINDIAWDSESKRIIAVGNGKERYGHAFTWDSGNSIGEISGHSAQINAVDIRSVRPYRAATVGDDSALCFFQGPPFRFEVSAREHTNFVKDVKFSKDGAHLVSVGMDKSIVLYDGKTGSVVRKISNAHDGGILSVCFVSNEQFVTASTDGTVKLWDAVSSDDKCVRTWSALPAEQTGKSVDHQQVSVVCTKDYIVSLSLNGDLNLFARAEESTATAVRVLQGHQKSIVSGLVLNETTLYTGSYDGKVCQWDLSTGEATPVKSHSNLIVGINKVGKHVISTGWDDKTQTIADNNDGFNLQLALENQPRASSSTDDKVFILLESSLQIYNANGSTEKTLQFKDPAVSLATSSKYIVVGFQTTNKVVIYSASDYSELHTIVLRSSASQLAISPDEAHLAIGDTTGKIPLYQLSDFSLVHSKWGFHTGKINSISWSSDSSYIVSGSLDTNVIVYSVKRPLKNLKFFGAHKDGVNFVSWIAQDRIVSGGADSAVKTYKVTFP